MSCDTNFEVLMAYLDGDLDPLERGRVAEHIVGCASCRETVNDLRAVSGALTKWVVPEPANLPSARELLDRAGVAVPAAAPPRAAWRGTVFRWSAAAVLAIVAGSIAVSVLNTRSGGVNETASSKAPAGDSQPPPAPQNEPKLDAGNTSAPGSAPAAPPPPPSADKDAEPEAPTQEEIVREKSGTPADGIGAGGAVAQPPAPVTAPLEDNLAKDEAAKPRAEEAAPAPSAAASGVAAPGSPAEPAEAQPRRARALPKASGEAGPSIQGAKLTLETTGLDSIAGRVDSAARSSGGRVSSRGPIVRRDGARRVEITVQVPVENLESAIARIKSLGTVRGEFRTNRAIGPRLAQLKRDKNEADDGRADSKTQDDAERKQLEAQANVATITVTIVEPE